MRIDGGGVTLWEKGKRKLINKCKCYRQKIVWLLKWTELKLFYHLHIMDSKKTIRYILEHGCSIARYGDGEFNLMQEEEKVGYQDISPELAKRLKEILGVRSPDLLLCIPRSFIHLQNRTEESKNFWREWQIKNDNQKRIVRYIWNFTGQNYVFGDAQITRPYIAVKNHNWAEQIFSLLKQIWQDRDILIVEGEFTRMGVGNDLLANAKSVVRILAPAKNAFSYYNDIFNAICQHADGRLVLLALGPTATVLAADLSQKKIQALDVGHMDVEYEWFCRKSNGRTDLKYKYVNEVKGGDTVAPCEDENYKKEIVARIGTQG